jgi:non-specific serine/threonine protein kinase
VAREQGDHARAAALLQESLALRRQAGHKRGIARCLEGLAGVGGARGHAERAARLYGAAAALRQAIGVPLPPTDRAVHERGLAAARARLGEAAFGISWAAGQSLALMPAIDYALESPDAPPLPGPGDEGHDREESVSGEPTWPAGPRR